MLRFVVRIPILTKVHFVEDESIFREARKYILSMIEAS